MRTTRLLVAALALALLGLLPATASSQATTAGHGVSSKAPATKVTLQGKEVRRHGRTVPVVYGTVNPPKGPVYIQKATQCRTQKVSSCNFKFFNKTFLKNGKYSQQITYPKRRGTFVWRAKVGKAVSPAILTCKTASGVCSRLP